MWALLIALCVAILLCAQITLQADVLHQGQTHARIRIAYAGFAKVWRLRLIRTGQGLQLLSAGAGGSEQAISAEQLQGGVGEKALALIRQDDQARHFLLRRLHLDRLYLCARVHTSSAASTSMLTGLLRIAAGFLPPAWRSRTKMAILPEFAASRSTLQLRCILHLRLGTIFITSAMLLAAYAARRHALKAREAA